MADLERVLEKVTKEEKARKRPLTRRFIVTEGLSEGVGDLVDLRALVSNFAIARLPCTRIA